MNFLFFRHNRMRLEADIESYLNELNLSYPGIRNMKKEYLSRLPEPKKKKSDSDNEVKKNGVNQGGDMFEMDIHSNLIDVLASLLAESSFQAKMGNIDRAYRLLNKAKQLEILGINDKRALINLGHKILNESSKLSSIHRKKSISEILSGLDKSEYFNQDIKLIRQDVFDSAKILGEHFDNEGFKVVIRTQSFQIFTFFLALLLVMIPIVVRFDHFHLMSSPEGSGYDLMKQVISVEVLGMLGAVFSVMISFTRNPIPGNIPQQRLMFQITLLRPIIGAAAGLVLFILYKAKLILGDNWAEALYALAFVSGFSERFIISQIDTTVVNSKNSEPQDQKKPEAEESQLKKPSAPVMG